MSLLSTALSVGLLQAGFGNHYQFFPYQRENRIPGYTGHVPEKRDNGIGMRDGVVSNWSIKNSSALKTQPKAFFQRTTTDPVLQPPQEKHTQGHTLQSDRHRVDTRPARPGHNPNSSPYSSKIVPGYAGFVPGSRYIDGCNETLSYTLGLSTHDREMEQRQQQRQGIIERTEGRRMRPQKGYAKTNTTTVTKVETVDGVDIKQKYHLDPTPTESIGPGSMWTGEENIKGARSTAAYNHNVPYGCKKHIPQKKWASVGKRHATWTSDVREDIQRHPDSERGGVNSIWAPRHGGSALKTRSERRNSTRAYTTPGGSAWSGVLTRDQVIAEASRIRTTKVQGTTPKKPKGGWAVSKHTVQHLPTSVLEGVRLVD
eukprot:m.43255 g.43255  ORF g.43255 m.43255 type:complete len:371 (+) comp9958_c0_seq2:476-1588(+)